MEDEEQQRSALPEEAAAAAAFIRPPRLEDAGLEDCALPPESVMEAFARAAISARPAIEEDDSDDDGPDENSASEASTSVAGAGTECELTSNGISVLGGEVSDSVREERAKEREEEEEEERSS
ncbi:hypothetical protein Cni_G07278 [Canna indica]|uniref:Uncharacterized protein n=1 Tax=Canna indica TaxID=4628 RepID=A0AAQ3JYG7_9LILI|nr:hypothetical protein Cni_G07278 [Canna indica]